MRVLLPAFTGTGDLYWYVKADSPLKTIKEATADNTIAYSTNGSSSNNIVVAFGQDGWELVSVIPGPNPEQLVAYLKRPKP